MSSERGCAKQNDRGKGSIRKTKSGSYEYRFYYVDEDNKARQKSITRKTIDECVEAAGEFLVEAETIRRRPKKGATVADILRQKAETDLKLNHTGEQGYGRNLEAIRTIERLGLGKMRIKKVKPSHINAFLISITDYSDKTIRKFYSLVRSAFEIAYDEGLIEVNYMTKRYARCPKSKKGSRKIRALTEEEQVRLLKALDEHKVPYGRNSYKLQILIALYSGMRMGEINALRPEDIDFERKMIHVHSTIASGLEGRPFVKESPKTTAGIRTVPINEMLEPVLKEALSKMKKNPEGLVFFDYNRNKNRKGSKYKYGGLIETSQVNNYFKRLLKKAGIEGDFGQHALRHTFATRCVEAGIEPVVLKKWMGHTDIHITLDIYTDVFDRLHIESTEKFDKLMGDIYKRYTD